MKCYICGSVKSDRVKGRVRDNPKIHILRCRTCGLVFLNNRKTGTSAFYEDGGMDRSIASANIVETMDLSDSESRFKRYGRLLRGKKVMDFGCGSGSFLRKLKREKVTPYLYALEPNKQHKASLEKDFRLYDNIDSIPDGKLDLITMFHVLEHLDDPVAVLNMLHSKLRDNGRIIIEVPSSDDALLNLYGSKAFANFTYWSCHLYLYNSNTLEALVRKTRFHIDSIIQHQRYTLANHLYWLAMGKPGGHNVWAFLDDRTLQERYEKKLADIGQCDTIVAVIKKRT